jgi:hypothetical protein
MRLSSSFAAPSAVAILSAALLCGPSGTAISQTATGSAAPLPGITIEVPKQVARPHRPKQVATPHGQVANTVASRRTSPTAQTPLATAAASAAPDSVLRKLAKLERASSSCNGGCETSFKHGDAPWVGCSFSGGWWSTFSPTCTDTLTYKTYSECMDTKVFLGWEKYKARWYCNGLLFGGKLAGEKHQVADLKR